MKVFALFFVIIAMLASAFALKDPICGLEHSANGVGPRACMAYMQSWTYKADTNECTDFVFGGCGGNENRFGSKQACEEKCLE